MKRLLFGLALLFSPLAGQTPAQPFIGTPQSAVLSRTLVLSGAYGGNTTEQKLTNTISQAKGQGYQFVYVPRANLPYNAQLVTFDNAVHVTCEGSNPSVWDVICYGAAADDVTNDAFAFSAAVGAAEGSSSSFRGIVVIPGTGGNGYLLGPTGGMSSGAMLSIVGGMEIRGNGQQRSVLHLATGSNKSMLELLDGAQGDNIENLQFEGNSGGQSGTSSGIILRAAGEYVDGRHTFNNLFIHAFLTDGFKSEFQHSAYQAYNVTVRNVGGVGFNIFGSDAYFFGCNVNNSTGDGFFFSTGFNHVVLPGVFATGGWGIHIAATATDVNVYNADVDHGQIDNIYVQGNGAHLIAGTSRDPGQSATATYAHILVDPGLEGIQILGWDFKPKSATNTALYDIRANGALAASVLGPNTYRAGSAATNTVLVGAAGPDFFWGRPRRQVTLAYGATVNTDLNVGTDFAIVPNNATAFTIANPTNVLASPDGEIYTWEINNTTGARTGAITFGGLFLMAGSVTPLLPGQRRTYVFKVQGGALIEIGRGGGETAIFQNSGLTTASASDVSVASIALPAASLAINSQAVRLTMRGSAVTGTGAPNIKFGATTLCTGSITAGNVYELDAIVTRTGATAQIGTCTVDNGTAISVNTRTTPAETLSGAVTIDFRGSITAGTLNVDYVQVEFISQ